MPGQYDLQAIVDGRASVPPPQAGTPQSASTFTVPPPGFRRTLYRGVAQGMAGIDQLGANMFSVGGIIPNAASAAAQGEADRRRAELSEIDAAEKASPSGTGANVAGGAAAAVIGAVPYFAAGGPLGSAALGAVENADQGPWEMVKGAAKGAAGAKIARALGGMVGSVVNATPVVRSAPEIVKRVITGATTGAAMGAGTSALAGGDTGVDAAAQGLAGGFLAGTQIRPSSRPPLTPDQKRADMLVAALGKNVPKGFNSQEAHHNVMADLDETARMTGKLPTTLAEHETNVDTTLGRMESMFQRFMAPIRQRTVYPTSIADAIESRITPEEMSGKTKEGEAIAQKLQERADEFKKEWSFDELDSLRKRLFENLHGKSKEALQARSDADIRADRAVESAVREILYPAADAIAQQQGHPAGFVANGLKAKQAQLIGIKDSLLDRVAETATNESIRRGTPLWQRTNLTTAIHPPMGIVTSVHGVTPMIAGDPRNLSSIDRLVGKAYAGKPGGVVISPPRQTTNRVPAMAAGALNDRNRPQETAPEVTPGQRAFLQWMGQAVPTPMPPVAQ